jgi:hypothetical protein
MADVDMTDAPSGSTAPAKEATSKPKTSAGDGGADGKKRFEVKKVRRSTSSALCDLFHVLSTRIVECRCFVGLGYCCRQLCYLQKPHHGSV